MFAFGTAESYCAMIAWQSPFFGRQAVFIVAADPYRALLQAEELILAAADALIDRRSAGLSPAAFEALLDRPGLAAASRAGTPSGVLKASVRRLIEQHKRRLRAGQASTVNGEWSTFLRQLCQHGSDDGSVELPVEGTLEAFLPRLVEHLRAHLATQQVADLALARLIARLRRLGRLPGWQADPGVQRAVRRVFADVARRLARAPSRVA